MFCIHIKLYWYRRSGIFQLLLNIPFQISKKKKEKKTFALSDEEKVYENIFSLYRTSNWKHVFLAERENRPCVYNFFFPY